jgi:hypothetical protein
MPRSLKTKKFSSFSLLEEILGWLGEPGRLFCLVSHNLKEAKRPGTGVVFIDEIQRKQDAGLFLKGLYDQDLPWKFVVSGSGSLALMRFS